ncbi:MAG TPA: P-loop NTPase, partial [Polyangiales bacterium]|nr:P-loop NTPase [Polyangiales bacterium]
MAASLEEIERALRAVNDPVYGRSMSELGSLSGLELRGDTLALTAKLAAVSDDAQKQIAADIEKALAPLGVSKIDLRFTLEVPMRRTNADDPVPTARNVVLVMSGKGGVGKSTCAANLALALHRGGARVGLLDADIYGPSVPTMLGVSGHPRAIDGKQIEPLERFGMKLMSIGFLIESAKDAIIWRGPMVQGALNQFLADVAWGPLDYL